MKSSHQSTSQLNTTDSVASDILINSKNTPTKTKKIIYSFTRVIYYLIVLSGFLFMASSCKPSVKKYTENARQLMLDGKFEEAIPILNTAIKKNSSSHEAYNLRGAAYLELDRFEKAKEDLNKAIKLRIFKQERGSNELKEWTGVRGYSYASIFMDTNEQESIITVQLNKCITVIPINKDGSPGTKSTWKWDKTIKYTEREETGYGLNHEIKTVDSVEDESRRDR